MTATNTTAAGVQARASEGTRWGQLSACLACMVLIANLQYGWTLFVNPINKAHGWSIASIQLAFSIFIALETWLTPIHGWIVDNLGARRGPKVVVAFGGIMVAVGWIIYAYAQSLEMLYLGAVVGGTGGGAVYATCVGQAVKWFPDRRGLAVGLTAAGYGAGAALTVVPIRAVIAAVGYETAFFWFGLIQGGVVFVLAWLLRAPDPHEIVGIAAPKVVQTSRSYDVPILFGASALSVALIVDNICNGGARPLFGWISDQIGREYTMAIAFGLGGVAYWLLGTLGHAPWAFILFAALIFLTWGEIFSLFPSTCTDTFGTKFATVNLSLLYTAKGASAFLVPIANLIKSASGGWHLVFVLTAIMNFAVVGLALFVLKPLRERFLTND